MMLAIVDAIVGIFTVDFGERKADRGVVRLDIAPPVEDNGVSAFSSI